MLTNPDAFIRGAIDARADTITDEVRAKLIALMDEQKGEPAGKAFYDAFRVIVSR